MVALLLKNWQLVVIGLLLAALAGSGYYITLLKSQKETLVAEKVVLETELKVSQASVKSLQSAINDQNAAIEKLKADSDAREKAAAIAVAKAKAETVVAKKRATVIIESKIPEGKTACDAANDLFNEEIKNAK